MGPYAKRRWDVRREKVEDYSRLDMPLRCQAYASSIRPEVAQFGAMLPVSPIRHLQEQLALGFDGVGSLGTTSALSYIAEPALVTRAAGKLTIEINPGSTEVSRIVHHRIKADTVVAVQAIREAMSIHR